jgi:hypothetical protein
MFFIIGPQFSADPGSTLRLGFDAVYAIRPVKPSFLPVQPCAEMTAVVPPAAGWRNLSQPYHGSIDTVDSLAHDPI